MIDCSIYVSSNWTVEQFGTKLGAFLEAVVRNFSTIENRLYIIEIDENESYDEYRSKEFPDGFLYFRYLLDIAFKEEVAENICCDEVNKILEWCWNQGIAAIASCDFEHLLVENGGYNNTRIPW